MIMIPSDLLEVQTHLQTRISHSRVDLAENASWDEGLAAPSSDASPYPTFLPKQSL